MTQAKRTAQQSWVEESHAAPVRGGLSDYEVFALSICAFVAAVIVIIGVVAVLARLGLVQ